MIIISDTNILSSFAAGDALSLLNQLYRHAGFAIPPSVQQELEAGFRRGKTHLASVLNAVQSRQISVMSLSAEEELLTFNYPAGLDEGEREAIALAQTRKALLLSNDGKAIRYCQQRKMNVASLEILLRLLWETGVMSPDDVRALIAKMGQVEKLSLTSDQLTKIFTP